MFKWWNQPIIPNSRVRWNYPVIVGILWVAGKFAFTLKLEATAVALDLLTILFACIALASVQAMFSKPGEPEASPSEQEKTAQQKDKQHKRKAKRHP